MQQAMGPGNLVQELVVHLQHSRRPPRKQRAGGPSLHNLSKYLTRGFPVQEGFPARDNACQVMQEKDISKTDFLLLLTANARELFAFHHSMYVASRCLFQ